MDIRIRLKTYYPAGYPTGKPDRDHLWLIGISEFRSFACDIHRSDLLLLSAIYRWPFYSHVAPSPGRQKADLELFINPTTLNWGLPTPRYGSPRCTFPLLGKVHAFGLKPPRFVVDVRHLPGNILLTLKVQCMDSADVFNQTAWRFGSDILLVENDVCLCVTSQLELGFIKCLQCLQKLLKLHLIH